MNLYYNNIWLLKVITLNNYFHPEADAYSEQNRSEVCHGIRVCYGIGVYHGIKACHRLRTAPEGKEQEGLIWN